MKTKNQRFIYCLLLVFSFLVNHNSSFSQRDMTPGKNSKRNKVFGGPADRRELRPYGFQFSAGPAYSMTRLHNPTVHTEAIPGRPVDYVIDPSGKLGFFAEIGMAHFPMKAPKIKFIKKRFFSYYDWGLGFKYLGGKETTNITNYDPTGTVVMSTQSGEGNDLANTTKGYYNDYVYGRFTLHKNIYLGDKYYLDNGIGVNFDYRVLTGTQNYIGSYMAGTQHFHKPFVAQFHYDLGLGIKLRRGSYLIPGIQIPILGMAEFHKGNPSLQWYSSNYWPIYAHLKYIILLPKKKSKGCNEGTEEDRKRNKEYMQGQ